MMTLKGNALNEAIEAECILVINEGNVTEISKTLIHKRLKSKGIINGQVSTLSTTERTEIINRNNQLYLKSLGLKDEDVALFNGKNTVASYKEMNKRLRDQNQDMQEQLTLNTLSMISMVRMLKLQTNLPIEELLSPFLVRELRYQEISEVTDELSGDVLDLIQ